MTIPRKPRVVEPEPAVEEIEEVAVVYVTEVVEDFEWTNTTGEYRKTTVTRSWVEAAEDD